MVYYYKFRLIISTCGIISPKNHSCQKMILSSYTYQVPIISHRKIHFYGYSQTRLWNAEESDASAVKLYCSEETFALCARSKPPVDKGKVLPRGWSRYLKQRGVFLASFWSVQHKGCSKICQGWLRTDNNHKFIIIKQTATASQAAVSFSIRKKKKKKRPEEEKNEDRE